MVSSHIPVTIITGFLGSGKTTLLNRILSESHGIRFSLIINEFGEIGLDAGLLKNATQDFVEMDNGCLCCVLNEDLVETLKKLKARDDYEAVILETTGIADPLPVAWTFLREPFEDKYRFAAIITVVDCLHLNTMLQMASEVRLQIERADFIYLTKTDLCDDSQIQNTKESLQNLNPNARVVLSTDPDWLSLLFDVADEKVLPAISHVHDHSHHFQSLSISLKQKKVSLNDMEDFFMSLPKEVFRAKAVFFDEQKKQFVVMHAVCGRVEFYFEENYSGEAAAVFIGKGFDGKKIETALSFPSPLRGEG